MKDIVEGIQAVGSIRFKNWGLLKTKNMLGRIGAREGTSMADVETDGVLYTSICEARINRSLAVLGREAKT